MSPLAITSHVRSTLEQSTSTPEQASAGGAHAAQRRGKVGLLVLFRGATTLVSTGTALFKSVEVEEERGIRRRPYRHTLLNSLLHRHQAC